MRSTLLIFVMLISSFGVFANRGDAEAIVVFEELLRDIRGGIVAKSQGIDGYRKFIHTEAETLDARIRKIKNKAGGKVANLYRYDISNFKFEVRCTIKKMKDQEKRYKEECLSGGETTKDSYDIISGEITDTDPSYFGGFQGPYQLKYPFYYIRPKNIKGKLPLAIVAPPINGMKVGKTYGVVPLISEKLAEVGIASIIVLVDEALINMQRPLADIDGWIIRQVTAQRVMLDFIETEEIFKDADTNKIAAIGSSLGGIKTINLMGTEPKRIKAGVVAVAGGNFPYLWTSSKQQLLVQYRKKKLGKNTSDLAEKIYNGSISDPIFFKGARDYQNDLLMFAATKDSKVRPFSQLTLWEVLGKPAIYRLRGRGKMGNNHKYHIWNFAHTSSDVWIEFLVRKLK